mgnify:CR=1 FL=1
MSVHVIGRNRGEAIANRKIDFSGNNNFFNKEELDNLNKLGMLKNNSAQIIYATNSFVLSLSYNQANTTLISGHLDLSVYLHSFENGVTRKIYTMPSLSYCISYILNDQFVIGTLEKKVYICNEMGKVMETFDYSKRNLDLKDFIPELIHKTDFSFNGYSILARYPSSK